MQNMIPYRDYSVRQVAARLSPQWNQLDLSADHVGFAVDRVTLRHAPLPQILQSSCLYHSTKGGLVVAQFIEALHYKWEGCRFDSRWCHRNF